MPVLAGRGSISYDGPGLTTWTATWTGLTGVNPADGLSDADRATSAVNSESRGMWLGVVPAAASENTTFEFAQIGGPTAPCTAPLAKGPSTPDLTAASDTGSFKHGQHHAQHHPQLHGCRRPARCREREPLR